MVCCLRLIFSLERVSCLLISKSLCSFPCSFKLPFSFEYIFLSSFSIILSNTNLVPKNKIKQKKSIVYVEIKKEDGVNTVKLEVLYEDTFQNLKTSNKRRQAAVSPSVVSV